MFTNYTENQKILAQSILDNWHNKTKEELENDVFTLLKPIATSVTLTKDIISNEEIFFLTNNIGVNEKD